MTKMQRMCDRSKRNTEERNTKHELPPSPPLPFFHHQTPPIYLLELMYGHTQFPIEIDQNRFKFTVLGGGSYFCPAPLLLLPPPDSLINIQLFGKLY